MPMGSTKPSRDINRICKCHQGFQAHVFLKLHLLQTPANFFIPGMNNVPQPVQQQLILHRQAQLK